MIDLSYGKVLLKELVLHLSPKVMELVSKEVNQYLAFSFKEDGKRRILKASSIKFCNLMVE
jgi:hypothetical protein